MENFLPYIAMVVVAIVSGIVAHFTATKKSKSDLETLRETNKAEIEKLMSQHKLDLEALERKHEMDIEKMDLEHSHRLELAQKELEGNLGAGMLNSLMGEALKMPEIQQQLRAGMNDGRKKR